MRNNYVKKKSLVNLNINLILINLLVQINVIVLEEKDAKFEINKKLRENVKLTNFA